MANRYVSPITMGFTPSNGDRIRGTINGVEVSGEWSGTGKEGYAILKSKDNTPICYVEFIDGRTVIDVRSDSAPTTDYELHLYRYVPAGIVQIPQEYVEGLEEAAADATEAKTTAETAQSTANAAKTTAESIDMLGKTWTQSNVTSHGIYTIVYANGLWVAGSDYSGSLYYSTDGKTWTQSNRTNGYFGAIIYANGLWVAGSTNGGGGLYYSTDGKTWTQSNLTNGYLGVIVYANGLLVAGSKNSGGGLYYSTSKYALTNTVDAQLSEVKQSIDEIKSADVILPSSTPNSTKKFKITVDDAGVISATEVTT